VGGVLGGSHLVAVMPGIESPSRPGKTSVVSEPLDEHIDFYRLWLGVVKWMKTGRETPERSKLAVEMQKFFILGQLAPRAAFPSVPSRVPKHKLSPPGEEWIEIAVLHWLDRPNRTIRTEVTCQGHVVGREYFIFHEDPLCLEAWGEQPGQRFAGEWLRRVIQVSVDIIVTRAHPDGHDPIATYPNCEDPPDSGLMSVITSGMDAYLNLDRIWIEWLDLLKYPSRGHGVKATKLTIESDTDFTISQVVEGSKAETLGVGENMAQDVFESKRVSASTESQSIYIEQFTNQGETPKRIWVRFHQFPLRVQAWAETPGKRASGEIFAGYMEKMLNAVLADETQG